MVAITPKLVPSTTLAVDIGDGYMFPQHITPTDLRPDLVWWNDTSRTLCLAELTVCFESNFEEAAQRKTAKYTDLAEQVEQGGYSTTLLTLQVGSRGVPHYESFLQLASVTNMTEREREEIENSWTTSLHHQSPLLSLSKRQMISLQRNTLLNPISLPNQHGCRLLPARSTS